MNARVSENDDRYLLNNNNTCTSFLYSAPDVVAINRYALILLFVSVYEFYACPHPTLARYQFSITNIDDY